MSSAASTPGKRKRGRPRSTDENASSPLSSRTKETTTLSAIKRRRLNTHEVATATTTAAAADIPSIGQKISRKSSNDFAGTLLSLRTAKGKLDSSRRSIGRRSTASRKDIWEVDVSEDEAETEPVGLKGSKRSARRALDPDTPEVPPQGSAQSRSSRKSKKAEAREQEESQSDEIIAARIRGTRRSSVPDPAFAIAASTVFNDEMPSKHSNPHTAAKRGRPGRPRSDVNLTNKSAKVNHASNTTETPRRRGRPKKVVTDSEELDEGKRGRLDSSLATRRNIFNGVSCAQKNNDLSFEDLPEGGGDARKANETHLNMVDGGSRSATDELAEKPAAIRGLRGRQASGSGKSKAQSVEEDSDVACALCGGLDSEPPNEMLLCDDCDLGVHQKCYNVPVVPEGDWFCQECQSARDLLDLDMLAAEEQPPAVPSELPDIENISQHLRTCQRIVLDKLIGQRRVGLCGHDDEMQTVHQLIEQTVVAGEGNSMLVIGSRGSGKTNLVESIISKLSSEHRDHFHVVRLNGFIHTDDKLAAREIWRQLGREMDLEEQIHGRGPSYADTMASLLALFSHPSEIVESQTGQTATSVIIILDEFELFATHPRQTLLYNLFDIAQARKAPIAVLGLTARIDVVEMLEKRVKSRFSHRYVHLAPPKSLPAFWGICKAYLAINPDDLQSYGASDQPGQEEFLHHWNSMINDLYHKDAIFRRHIQSQYYISKSLPDFLTTCFLPISSLSPTHFPLTGRSFTSSPSLLPADSKLHLLPSLAELECALLICAARLDVILDAETCNFGMAYEEYSRLTTRYKIQTSGITIGVSARAFAGATTAKLWSRDVALGAWERLADLDLLLPAMGQGSSSSRSSSGAAALAGGGPARMWKVDVALEEIPGSVQGLSSIMTKWCREI